MTSEFGDDERGRECWLLCATPTLEWWIDAPSSVVCILIFFLRTLKFNSNLLLFIEHTTCENIDIFVFIVRGWGLRSEWCIQLFFLVQSHTDERCEFVYFGGYFVVLLASNFAFSMKIASIECKMAYTNTTINMYYVYLWIQIHI